MYAYSPCNDFFVTLLSNNSTDRFGDNVQSAFTNYIDPPIILCPGEWTVGITEIFHNAFTIKSTLTGRPQLKHYIKKSEKDEDDGDESLVLIMDTPAYEFIYVHSDIIAERNVGDQRVRCLKVTPTHSNPEQMIRFGLPEYYPVNVSHIRSISVEITNQEGERIEFNKSTLPTMITLHFLKRTPKTI